MTLSLKAQYLTPDSDTHWTPSTAFNATQPDNASDADNFIIDNVDTPSAQGPGGYSIDLESASGSFTYNDDSVIPNGGYITKVEVKDNDGNVYFTVCGDFADPNLVDFWNTYQSSGAKAALDQLIGSGYNDAGLQLLGSSQNDYAETYGVNGYYDLQGGDDTLAISYGFTTAYGGTGNDTFLITKGGLFGLNLHGGAPMADGSTPETNTVNFTAPGTLSFDSIDGIDHFVFSAPTGGQFLYLTTDQLPGGSTSTFNVVGSSSGQTNEVVIERAGTGALHLDLSHVTVSNFARLNEAFVFDFGSDTQSDTVVGVTGARNVFDLGAGPDRAIGGALADVFMAGPGNDFFNGMGGADVVDFDGPRSQFKITKVGANRFTVHDLRAHSPDGTDTLVNIEYAHFNNKDIYLPLFHA